MVPLWDMFPFCWSPRTCSLVQTSQFTWLACKEFVDHHVECFLENPGPLSVALQDLLQGKIGPRAERVPGG